MEEQGEEDTNLYNQDITYVCKCILPDEVKEVIIPPRKLKALNVVEDTERYLREHRIQDIIEFMMTQILAHLPPNPVYYLEKLLDDCMLFRAGLGKAPVLYELPHLEAVVKSFDPGDRGWMTAGQVRRAYITLGLTPDPSLDGRIPTDEVLNMLKESQEQELLELVRAGLPRDIFEQC